VEEVMKRLSEGPSPGKQESIVERLAVEAIGLGADELEVEYKDGCEWAFAAKAGLGFGIASFRSSSPEAGALRDELHRLAKRKRRIVVVDGLRYELRGHSYDSFGEEAYRVDLRRV
jgi:hypothetical protein